MQSKLFFVFKEVLNALINTDNFLSNWEDESISQASGINLEEDVEELVKETVHVAGPDSEAETVHEAGPDSEAETEGKHKGARRKTDEEPTLRLIRRLKDAVRSVCETEDTQVFGVSGLLLVLTEEGKLLPVCISQTLQDGTTVTKTENLPVDKQPEVKRRRGRPRKKPVPVPLPARSPSPQAIQLKEENFTEETQDATASYIKEPLKAEVCCDDAVSDPGMFECKECLEVFPDEYLLTHHLQADHDVGAPHSMNCQFCLMKFEAMEDLDAHIWECHRQEDSVNFQCKACQGVFHSVDSLLLHIDQVHWNLSAAFMDEEDDTLPLIVTDEAAANENLSDEVKLKLEADALTEVKVKVLPDEDGEAGPSGRDLMYKENTDGEAGPSGRDLMYKDNTDSHASFDSPCEASSQVYEVSFDIGDTPKSRNRLNAQRSKQLRNARPKCKREARQCEICSKVLYYAYSYTRHMLNHKKAKEVKPKVSEEKKTAEKCEKTCEICCKVLYYKDSYTRHMNSHKGIFKYSCSLCPKKFNMKQYLVDHMNKHNNVKPYVCAMCGVSYHSSDTLRCHEKNKHKLQGQAKKPDPQDCEICGQTFCSKDSLRRHKRFIHDAEDKAKRNIRVPCPDCGKYVKKYILSVHQKNMHGARAGPHVCTVCKAVYRSWTGFREHQKVHRGQQLICKICAKVYSSSKAFKDHVNLHTGKKPYVCSYCGISFMYQTTWKGHELTHIANPSFCSICGKSFQNKRSLYTHQRSVHRVTRSGNYGYGFIPGEGQNGKTFTATMHHQRQLKETLESLKSDGFDGEQQVIVVTGIGDLSYGGKK